jgi:hypothetical protein
MLRRGWIGLLAALTSALGVTSASGVELVRLTPENWSQFAPRGKEVDCIYGDLVLRNDRITAVIAAPLSTRNANMTVRNVGWAVIDLTSTESPNDQLSAFYPGSLKYRFTLPNAVSVEADGRRLPVHFDALEASGRSVTVTCLADRVAGRPEIAVRYTLRDGDPFVFVETVYVNRGEEAFVEEELSDTIRADRTFQFGLDENAKMFWAEDEWFRQTYGVLCDARTIERAGDRGVIVRYKDGDSAKLEVGPQEVVQFTRILFPASSLLDAKGLADALRGQPVQPVSLTVSDSRGPVRHARVTFSNDRGQRGSLRTLNDGTARLTIPAGEWKVSVEGQGRPPMSDLTLAVAEQGPNAFEIQFPDTCGLVLARITDEQGQPIPCKVGFYGIEGTPSPDYGPDTDVTVRNLRYSHNGRFRQEIAPGKYRVIISYGPEYDAVFRDIEIGAGEDLRLNAQLVRTVDTTGWISSDFHSHSTPSGDNTCSQRARVLNLLCEHIEFAPCTEHNRVDSYMPHLRSLGVEHLMATSTGIELTGQPLPVNHQNAFPLRWRPRTQDGGGPVTDENPLVQIERLALWDDAAEKLVQGNHPNLIQVLGDRDTNGEADGGFAKMLDFMDVIEVHPLQPILLTPGTEGFDKQGRNPIFHWMQMLNLGYRITGVVNTDAHYSFHGSGPLRNYIRSSSDDPMLVSTLEMVRSSTAGHIVMTNGPFLNLAAAGNDPRAAAGPGDNLAAPDKKVQLRVLVQCPNWLDVNRVQVFVNGRPVESANFTRRSHPERFGSSAVKFDSAIPLELTEDSHIIVVAAGEGLELGPVMGPDAGKAMPIAVTNPVFVDVDGNGFQANGDLLGMPLPLEQTILPIR